MVEQQSLQLESLVNGLVSAGLAPDTQALERLAQTLGKLFNVDPDEVAILRLDPKSKNLKFVLPEKLAAVGSIPLSSATALAARTAREERAEVMNNFSAARHASVFEGVPLGSRQGEPIQKIMSAPILNGAQVCGVVQISRKGSSAAEAGADFTQKHLNTLTSICPVLCRFVKLCQRG